MTCSPLHPLLLAPCAHIGYHEPLHRVLAILLRPHSHLSSFALSLSVLVNRGEEQWTSLTAAWHGYYVGQV